MYKDSRPEWERAKDKKGKKREWYKEDGKYESVMFVQPTKGSELKLKVQQLARRNGLKMRVIEKAGLTIKKILQKSNPFEKKICGRDECAVCEYGKKGDCRSRGCVYQLMCKEDWKKYRGQTGRSAHERTNEEMDDWTSMKEMSPLWKHSVECHGGRRFDLDVKVMNRSFGKASRRMIAESVLIEQLKDGETMNSKQEWTYHKLNKVHVN